MMKLHGAMISPNVRKAIIGFNIKGVEFEANNIVPGPDLKKPEYLAINPLGLIPALQDGDLTVGDSNIILQYLDEKYPEHPLMPEDPRDRAECRWIAEYAGSALFPLCFVVFRQNFVGPNFFKEPTDQALVDETVNEKLPPVLDYLEARTPDIGFLFGADLTIADISVLAMLITAAYGSYSVDGTRWPKLAAFVSRGLEHPAVAQALQAEKQMVEMIRAAGQN